MSQNNNLSIDEILREAQEVLSSIGGGQEQKENSEVEQDDIKTYVPPKNNSPEKSEDAKLYSENDGEAVKEFHPKKEKTHQDEKPLPENRNAQQKTRAIPNISRDAVVSDKTMRVPQKKSEKSRFFKKYSADEEYSSTPPQIIEKAATIRSKSRFDKTSDLQEIPTILAVEELDKTRRILSSQSEQTAAI